MAQTAESSPRKKKRAKSAADPSSFLRLRTDARHERRFEPKHSIASVIGVAAMSIGAVLVGAGTYGQWLRGEELGPHKFAPWLLGAGAAVFLLVALFGQRLAKPVRVGDAGVAQENDPTDIERVAWCDVKHILVGGDMITVQSHGTSISVPVKPHALAAARLLAEARARIPNTIDGELDLPTPSDDDGALLPLEAPQIAGLRCKNSDKLIAFERDARLCGRCGELYHKDSVPKLCLTCEAKLA